VNVHNARVVLLAGPSGSGKSYVARRTGLPVLCLDDFYKDGMEHTIPRVKGVVNWESPQSWDATAALTAIAELSEAGQAMIPVYDIGRSKKVDERLVRLPGAPLFIAEGILAAEIVPACTELGVLADAVALRRPRTVTFIRRLTRDLAERRKPPALLVRRGLRLWATQPSILDRQRELGCRPMTAGALLRRIQTLKSASRTQA
jgi:uridine kinase